MKNYLITAGIALGVVLLTLTLMPQKVINSVQTLGAVSSPDIMSPYFSFGGVRQWAAHTESLGQATTTVCALQSPAATSTLLTASIRYSVSSTTASTVTMAKATTAYATTTLIGGGSLAANAQGTFNATTTLAQATSLDGVMVFAPSAYLVVGMAGGTGTFSPTGTCQAIWVQNAY